MQIDQLKPFYKSLKDNQIIFSFSGPLSQAVLESFVETIRQKLYMDDTGSGTIQRVFSIFVEQAQNILNYSEERTPASAEREQDIRAGVLLLGTEGPHHFVCCGNYIASADVEALTRELDLIRSLPPDGIKKLYRERRRADAAPKSAGAGLGLIEMARRAAGPLAFDINPIDAQMAFFAIKAII